MWLSDPLERQALAAVSGQLTDGQHSGWLDLRRADRRNAWQQGWQQHAETIRSRLRSLAIPLTELDTQLSARDNLLPSLGRQARRQGSH